MCAGQQRVELLVMPASKVRGGVAAAVEECSFSSCLSTSQQMKLLLIPVSFLLRICHYLSSKLPAEVLLLNDLHRREIRTNNFTFLGHCKSLFLQKLIRWTGSYIRGLSLPAVIHPTTQVIYNLLHLCTAVFIFN